LAFVALAAAACVEPTVGATQALPRAAGPVFSARVAVPAAAPHATLVGGSVDGFEPGQVAYVVGWAPSEGAKLIVVAEGQVELMDPRRLVRPDAAAAVGDPKHARLGFRFFVRSRTGAVDRVCVLAQLPDGDVAMLAGSDKTLCPPP
jgi:hypothetical protein